MGTIFDPFNQRNIPMTENIPSLLIATLIVAGCGGEAPSPTDYATEAWRIAKDSIIIDAHVDVPYRLARAPQDVSQATVSGDFDYPRAVAGGLNAPFMSIYTPASLEAEGRSREVAEELIDTVEAIVANAPDKFAIATSVADVRKHFETGLMSLPLGMDNGSPR